MAKAVTDIRSLARAWTPTVIRTLGAIVAKGESEAARVAACSVLLDRGWGKAPQSHTGEDGQGAIQVIIRHIIGGRDAPATIEYSPIVSVSDDTSDR